MEREEIRKELIRILVSADESKRETAKNASDDTDLITGLGLNSVGMLYMVIAIETTFMIRFDDVGMADMRTFGDVIDYVDRKLNGR